MKKRTMGTLSVTATCAAAISACMLAEPAAAQRAGANADGKPNILLIIADDIGLDTTTGMAPGLIDSLVEQYGPSGHDHSNHEAIAGHPASTPVLDEFARDGMVFTNAWAQPFCSPTRASILTGLFSSRTNVLTPADPLSQNHLSFVEILKDEGNYSSAIIGKWHMAGVQGGADRFPGMKPLEAGFDLFKGNFGAAIGTYWRYEYHVQDDATAPTEWRTEPAPERSLPGIAPTTYAAVAKGADTIEWIEAQEAANPDKPWFVWLAFNLAHATAQREPSQMIIPNADTLDAVTRAEIEACGGKFGTAELGECSGEAVNRAMTNSMDTVIGKVLEAVDRLDPNTYVIYIGDNGTPMYGRPGLNFIDNMYITRAGRGKGTAYESGARVPIAVRGPRVEAGRHSTEFVHAADLFSTILDLAGLEVPARVPNRQGTAQIDLDAVSLAPMLLGRASSVRDPNQAYLLTETATGARQQVGARNGAYKVVCMNDAQSCEFYDLVNDPLEEYPLDKPGDCAKYADRTWTAADREWHYCRLTEVVATESFFADEEARAARAAAGARGAGPRGRGAGAGGRGAGAGARGAGPGGRGGARGGRAGGRGAAPS